MKRLKVNNNTKCHVNKSHPKCSTEKVTKTTCRAEGPKERPSEEPSWRWGMDTDPVDRGDLAQSTSVKEAMSVRLDLLSRRAVTPVPQK